MPHSTRFPELVAHRGYALRYPENTLSACRAAFEAGARNIEIDVQVSADGTPFLYHDDTLERVSARAGSLVDLSDAEIAELRAGEPDRFGDQFGQEPVAELREFCDLLARWPDVRRAFVEVKPIAVRRHGVEATLRAVLDALAAVRERCVLISFSIELLAAARRETELELALILSAWDQLEHDDARALAGEYTFVNHHKLPAEGPIARDGTRLVVYEIVDPGLALELAGRGAEFVETFAIAEMAASLRELGAPE